MRPGWFGQTRKRRRFNAKEYAAYRSRIQRELTAHEIGASIRDLHQEAVDYFNYY